MHCYMVIHSTHEHSTLYGYHSYVYDHCNAWICVITHIYHTYKVNTYMQTQTNA